MFSILVVLPGRLDGADLQRELPSVEVLRAQGAEDAVEKLARNRRIDAILILEAPDDSLRTLEAIAEENPAPPPVFVPLRSGSGAPPGTRGLPDGTPAELVKWVVDRIAGGGP